MNLETLFLDINAKHFQSYLELPQLVWNSRLRAAAGRFVPCRRLLFYRGEKPTIEIAKYLLDEKNASDLVVDTMAHEMIHFWLWSRRRPYGHNAEFLEKMRIMGVSRYNPVPRIRPYKFIYECPFCGKEFPARKKLGKMACKKCCETHSGGLYDPRFRLLLKKTSEQNGQNLNLPLGNACGQS